VRYLDLVRYVVSKFDFTFGKAHGLDYNDMVHFGVLGCWKPSNGFTIRSEI
jgi:DNA-directed RNA polymerase specialized sigma subunit